MIKVIEAEPFFQAISRGFPDELQYLTTRMVSKTGISSSRDPFREPAVTFRDKFIYLVVGPHIYEKYHIAKLDHFPK